MTTLGSGPGKTFLVATVMAALAVLLPRSAAAQAVSGTISGNVVDAQGSVIPGATVTVVNEATSDARVAVSDGKGPSWSPTCSRVSTRSGSRCRVFARSNARTSS